MCPQTPPHALKFSLPYSKLSGAFTRKRKKEKITPLSKNRHEDEPVGLLLITVFYDAT
jgi:hypothetical protein